MGVDLSGGLRNPVFQNLGQGLSARIVTAENRIIELNVVADAADINQSKPNPDDSGAAVIAVRPKRPPMRRS